jgi:hypothetical protein
MRAFVVAVLVVFCRQSFDGSPARKTPSLGVIHRWSLAPGNVILSGGPHRERHQRLHALSGTFAHIPAAIGTACRPSHHAEPAIRCPAGTSEALRPVAAVTDLRSVPAAAWVPRSPGDRRTPRPGAYHSSRTGRRRSDPRCPAGTSRARSAARCTRGSGCSGPPDRARCRCRRSAGRYPGDAPGPGQRRRPGGRPVPHLEVRMERGEVHRHVRPGLPGHPPGQGVDLGVRVVEAGDQQVGDPATRRSRA